MVKRPGRQIAVLETDMLGKDGFELTPGDEQQPVEAVGVPSGQSNMSKEWACSIWLRFTRRHGEV